ncbi:MAG: hypothetical protein IKD09_02665 [Lentisphaeria bacterium]|nr:hypothetical protein [Lentisphaeria bacterium]
MSDTNKNYYVVSHTHWDREWYEPFEVFRFNLVKMIDFLLDTIDEQPDFKFNMDCQTIMIEDYLAIRPHRKDKLLKAIANGNIMVGPWYVQNDFYQTSGESTIRNILTGVTLARKWGVKSDFVGYAPDHGGIIAQMPQILNGFGIDALVFGRGRIMTPENGRKNTFITEGPDGSQVLTVFLFNFYNSAQRFSADAEKAWKYFTMVQEKEDWGNATNNYLLMNGVDHLFPQADLNVSMAAIQAKLPDGDRIFQSTLADYVAAQKRDTVRENLEVHHGELFEPVKERLLMPGVASSRIAQKAAITDSENTLFIRVQGLCSILAMAGFDKKEYDKDILNYLWHLSAQSLAHDSVWGCSADSTHRHIADRLECFNEVANCVINEKMQILSAHSGKFAEQCYKITVVNPFPYGLKAVIETTLDIAEDDELGSFKLFDTDGKEIAYYASKKELEEHALRSPVNLPGRINVYRRQISFTADMPAFGYKVFKVVPTAENSEFAELGNSNGIIKVKVDENGRIDLTDLRDNRLFKDVLSLEDTGDLGDAYSYKPIKGDVPYSTLDIKADSVKMTTSPQRSDWVIDYKFNLPASNNSERTARSDIFKDMNVSIKLSIFKDCPYMQVKVSGNNNIKDHFLRAVIRSGIAADMSASTGAFEISMRDRKANPEWEDREKFTRDYVKLQSREAGGMAILTGSLHSFEHFVNREGEVALGLIRSNGYILGFYETPKDKTWIVPENQVQGEFECKFAIMPCEYSEKSIAEIRAAQVFATPLLSYADSSSVDKFAGGRPCVQDSDVSEIFKLPDPYKDMELPHEMSFIDSSESDLLHSTIKMTENGSDFILRMWNPLHEASCEKIKFAESLNNFKTVNFLEKETASLNCENNCVELKLKPCEIASIKIKNS